MVSSDKRQAVAVTAVVLWLAAIGFGVRVLLLYSNTPGEAATPAVEWPRATRVQRQAGRATLVVFVHPQCSCSAATIEELARILAHAGDRTTASVLFYAPREEPPEWVRSELWRSAAEIPGIQLMEDREGGESRRFHAFTSGQTLLYDAGGRLAFRGGITARRGHAGDNDGSEAILDILFGKSAPRRTAPVFGCSLLGAAR